ncbi:MAG: hypothetical protein QNJ44_24265 [Rhodobacter sp.]|nr:hypothetical protein [Rhodobacter sp.]
MDTALRPSTKSPIRTLLGFAVAFLLLYAIAVAIAERTVGRADTETAFQKLLAARGQQVDWLVIGASHALPFEFGEVPERLEQETGQSMLVLAEIGAGPLYNRFIVEQALHDLEVKHLIYVIDSFAFASEEWNEDRLSDRGLLRKTPLRLSTAQILGGLVLRSGTDPRGLFDYLTGFSKLNPVDRFPTEGWKGAASFDRRFRPSRHAVSARISYLYPGGAPEPETVERNLNILDRLYELARAAEVDVTLVKPPVPRAFADSLPGEDVFDAALLAWIGPREIEVVDLSDAMPDPEFYFDTDHLNRDGVALFYSDFLGPLIERR